MSPKSEYKGRHILDYKKDTEVVVNIGGEWKKARVKNDAVLAGKKLNMEVEYVDEKGNPQTKTIDIDGDAPRVIREHYFDFEDPEKGKVRVSNPEVAEDGSIEYTVDYGNDTYTGVPVEIVELWKKSVKIGEKLRMLKVDVGTQGARKHMHFIEKSAAAEKMIADIFALVREGKRIDSFDRIEIEKRQRALSQLIDVANEEISKLEDEVQGGRVDRVTTDVEIDVNKEYDQTSARVRKLIDEIPLKKGAKTPEPAYQAVYTKMNDVLVQILTNQKNLKDEQSAYQAGLLGNQPQSPGRDEWKKIATQILEHDKEEVDELEREVRVIQSKHTLESYKKTKKKEVIAEDEKYVPVINIPEHLMRELLKSRHVEVESAVRALFTHDLSEAMDEERALEAFRDIFSDDAPDADVLNKLKKYGIREWGQFKKLWDEKFADTMLRTMHEMAKALVKKEVAARITLGNKVGKLWGTLLGRAAISGALIGGSALALTAVLGSGGLGGFAVAAGAGGLGGLIKSKIHQKLGGKFQKKITEKMEELEHEKHDEVLKNVVDQMLAGVTGKHAGGGKHKGSSEFPSFMAALAQGLRDITTEENTLKDAQAPEVEKLTGNARVLYEQILAHVDTQEPSEKVRTQLAQVVSRLNGNGDVKQIIADKTLDSKLATALGTFFNAYSGKDGAVRSTVVGAVAGAAFFAGEAGARIGFGALLGARTGYKMGELAENKAREKESRNRVFTDIEMLRTYTKKQFEKQNVPPEERKKSQDALMRLKRLLHTSLGASLDELAVFGVVGREKKAKDDTTGAGWIDAAGRVVIDATGKILDPELKFLVQDMRSAVNDAEEYGLLHEQPENRQKLATVLDQLKQKGDEIAKEQHGNGKSKWIKWAYAVGGAVVGAVTAWAPREVFENMSRSETVSVGTPEVWVKNSASPETVVGSTTTASAVESTSVSSKTEVVPVSESVRASERADIFVGEIKKGEGVLHGANRAIDKAIESGKFKIEGDVDGKITDAELRAWKIKELKNMGFVFEKGKWGYPFTVHPGAEVVIRTDENGNAQLALIDDPKKISHHEFIKFKDTRGGTSEDIDQEALERARLTSKQFEREMITAGRPDAPVHVGVKADPELSRRLLDDNGNVAGIVGARARNDGGVSLELENGKMVEAFAELDPRLGTGMELDPSVPQWTLKQLEYAPGVSLPYETIEGTGKGRVLDSNIPVTKSDAFLTRDEYTKIVEGQKIVSGNESKGVSVETPVQKQAAVSQPEAQVVEKREVITEEKSDVTPRLLEHRAEIRREFDQVNNVIKSRLDNLADTRYMSRADVKKDFLSDMQEMERLVQNNKYDEIPIERFKSLLKDTTADATAIERLFLRENFQYPSVTFAGNAGALNVETEVIDGKQFSWAMLEITKNGQTTDYLFGVPEGYTLSVDNGVAKLVDAGGVPHGIKLSEDNLSHAFIMADDTRQANSTP